MDHRRPRNRKNRRHHHLIKVRVVKATVSTIGTKVHHRHTKGRAVKVTVKREKEKQDVINAVEQKIGKKSKENLRERSQKKID